MTDNLTQEQIQSFVIPCHGQLGKVQEMLTAEPRFLDAVYEPWQESGLGAASHVGNRAIAEYLLAQGAALTICAAAMLGRVEDVAAFIAADPAQANANGAHGISVLYHAALSGDTAVTDRLLAHGNTQDMGFALHAAVSHSHVDMVRWLLHHNAPRDTANFQGKTPLQVAKENDMIDIVTLLQTNNQS